LLLFEKRAVAALGTLSLSDGAQQGCKLQHQEPER